jgi:hypothetical protein
MTHITLGIPREHVIKWVRKNVIIKLVESVPPELSHMTKIFERVVAGRDRTRADRNAYGRRRKNKKVDAIRLYPFTYPYRSAPQNTVFIYSDAGRIAPFYTKNETRGI